MPWAQAIVVPKSSPKKTSHFFVFISASKKIYSPGREKANARGPGNVDFSRLLSENKKDCEALKMKDFFKALFTIAILISAFFVGFHFGKTKEKEKIPNFQEDLEEKI